MLNNKEDYALFFLIIILVSYLMMNKEKFTVSSSAPPPECDPRRHQKLCNGKCISLSKLCCPPGDKECQNRCIPLSRPCCSGPGVKYCYHTNKCISVYDFC